MDAINELLTRGVANIIPGKALLDTKLRNDKLNIYLGIDPTATHIHLGHAVLIRKLQQFAELGHNVTFLIGDFTSLIGDTSDKESERPVLTSEEIQENFKTYKSQAEKLLDFSKVNVKHNSEWLSKLNFADIIQLCQHFSFGDFASRELVKKRLTEGKRVGLHEALYPVMQGYDSYFMDTDLQIGGTDQTFNMQAGRILQKDLRNKESYVLTTVFLEGTDGRKMSKTWGNAIWLDDTPSDVYGKVMSLKDELIIQYFTLATNLPMDKIDEIEKRLESGENPMNLKKELAKKIVTELHSEEEAQKAQDSFENTVQKGELPEEIKLFTVEIPSMQLIELIVEPGIEIGAFTSKSDAKRLIEQNGVEVDGQKINNPFETINLDQEKIIRLGKRGFIKVQSK